MKLNQILSVTALLALITTFGCNKDSLLNQSEVNISEDLLKDETIFNGKRKCSTHEYNEGLMLRDPAFRENQRQVEEFTTRYIAENKHLENRSVITIPVVVHVVYKTAAENVSKAIIQSQLNVLNADFRKLNADRNNVPNAFKPRAADFEINFCLAQRTPNNRPTNGIERRQTDVDLFTDNNDVKFNSNGGLDAWDATKYLNIWVCNLGSGLSGYAQFPGGDIATDGVVILYSAFGKNSPFIPYNLGRTTIHEVGHWLNLRHVWGDDFCGDDHVLDTPTQEGPNFGCVTFPHRTCGNTTSGDMFMNYMDYGDDNCVIMFSAGQKGRALAAIWFSRNSLLSSQGCTPP